MNISSVLVIPRPGCADATVRALHELDGVEVAAVSPEGRIIATLEAEDDAQTVQSYEAIAVLQGVLSVAMVYHHREDEPDAEILLAA